jgi:hypothetical protein
MCSPLKFVALVLLSFLAACSSGKQKLVSIPPGMRAVTVHPSDKLRLLEGDHVDVVVIDKASHRSVVVENVAVVAADTMANVITLLVNPQENDKIMAAAAENKVTLTPHRGF